MITWKKMSKKMIAVGMMASLIFSTVGCSNDGKKESTSSVVESSSEEVSSEVESSAVDTTEESVIEATKESEIEATEETEEVTTFAVPESCNLEAREVPAGYDEMRGLTATDLVAELKIGWNLGNTMDAEGGETAWGNPVTTKEMIDAIAAKGFNTIRIPVSWGQFTANEEGEYLIDTAFLTRVGDIIDYALANDMYVIMNTHHETKWIIPTYDELPNYETKFVAIWTQLATYFADYGDHLIFEGLNEPRVIGGTEEWNGGIKENRDVINTLEADFLATVRATGGKNETRLLLFTSEAACIVDNGLRDVVVPDDAYVGMSLHAYTPYDFTFTHDGDYTVWDGSHSGDVRWAFSQMNRYFISKGIPVVVTEYGAERKGSNSNNNDEEVAKWLTEYLTEAEKYGIPTVLWDNGNTNGDGERFGYFNRKTCTWDREVIIDAAMDVIYQ